MMMMMMMMMMMTRELVEMLHQRQQIVLCDSVCYEKVW